MKFLQVAGVSAALCVSGVAHGGFLGLFWTTEPDAQNPNLLILNLFLGFDDPGDRAIALNGFSPALGEPDMYFRTNVTGGFHQVPFFGSDRDFAVTPGELGAVPAMANDTYFNVGIKSGEVTAGGVVSGSADDISSGAPSGILFGWNGGNELVSDPTTGGSFDLVDVVPPISDQNIAGATPAGNSIFIAQFVLDTNAPTNDGFSHHVQIQIGNLVWRDATGADHVEGFDPAAGVYCPLYLFAGTLQPCGPPLGDVNQDFVVNVLDLIQLLLDFGDSPGWPSDLNCDGTVDVIDLIEVLLHFGECRCLGCT